MDLFNKIVDLLFREGGSSAPPPGYGPAIYVFLGTLLDNAPPLALVLLIQRKPRKQAVVDVFYAGRLIFHTNLATPRQDRDYHSSRTLWP